ncbi:hypothetical protein BDZ45DRAFT_737752 [Acephala macrosclerotiorum]|nr:hypothetical protein BDZ45DRAFT_737752 [Acephala macrosclerotiorum]
MVQLEGHHLFRRSNPSLAQTLAAQRIAAYLNNSIDSTPYYEHTKTTINILAKTKDVKAYLDNFDETMNKIQN